MTVLDSKLYNTNLQKTASNLELSEIQNKSILVTGGLGLICSTIVDLLVVASREKNLNVNIYLAAREKRRFDDKYGKTDNVHFVEYDALKPVNFKFDIDYITCGAGVASPDKYISEPVETRLSNITGVKNILEYSKQKMSNVLFTFHQARYMGKSKQIINLQKASMEPLIWIQFVPLMQLQSRHQNSFVNRLRQNTELTRL